LTLYQALMLCATGQWQHPLAGHVWGMHLTEHPHASALYEEITTHQGQLRLNWATIRQHADGDLATLQRLPDPDEEGGGAGLVTGQRTGAGATRHHVRGLTAPRERIFRRLDRRDVMRPPSTTTG
jgi:hypothetical protein